MHSRSKITQVFTIFSYLLLTTLSLSALIIFKPFTMVDNDTSKIVCQKGGSFDAGPNYIYTFEQRLDSFNDEKARKLCEFGIIRDYHNVYKTPLSQNYDFKPIYRSVSSWGDALLVTGILMLGGCFLIELVKKNGLLMMSVSCILCITSIFLYIQKIPFKLNCNLQIAYKVTNFRNSAYKGGVVAMLEEDAHINSVVKVLYKQCYKQ